MRYQSKIFWGILLLCAPLLAVEERIESYLDFLKDHASIVGDLGNYKEGEIEIVIDAKKIQEIEEMQKKRALKAGLSLDEAIEGSRVGLISSDQYWVWVRDAVIFPTGAEGTYNRIIKRNFVEKGKPGVAILPVLPDGKIALVLTFRHATRSWQLEIPRGNNSTDEAIVETAIRELKEETGLTAGQVHFLGEVPPASGCLNTLVTVYLGRAEKKGISSPDFSEAILRTETYTLKEIKAALSAGYMEIDVKGKKERVMIYDPFLTFALFQAEQKNLL